MASPRSTSIVTKMNVVGLFAGIGGIERGLARAGHRTSLLCENDRFATAVLKSRFPDIPLHDDVTTLKRLPPGVDLIAGGFPCQDLSQAGGTRGIEGARSGLVSEVFRLLEKHDTPHVLLENVPFMLQLAKGRALEVIITELERLRFRWAYRVVDTRNFGLPQRRERVYLFASRTMDPAEVLFADDAGARPALKPDLSRANGFYWTEGLRGLGWADDAVPTLKGGSTIGIASPPAIAMPDGCVVTPDIRDAERLQGFPVDWTLPAEAVGKRGYRWKLVGNAVSVDVAEWVGNRIALPGRPVCRTSGQVVRGQAWPRAAVGLEGIRLAVEASSRPLTRECPPLAEFLEFPTKGLSLRAISGFASRLDAGRLRLPAGFRDLVERYQRTCERAIEHRAESAVA